MPQVQFGPGPFPEQYADGHPPEKETEEERRRYRCGLVIKGCQSVNTHIFEEAFQAWLKQRSKDSNKAPDASTVFAKVALDDSVSIKLDKRMLDLSPFAAQSLVVDIPSEGDSPTFSQDSDSSEGGQSQQEVEVVNPECKSVPL